MAKLLDAVNRFRKVEEVCSSNDTLPPVYLMDEVVQLCQESTESAQSVAEHVNRNLQHKSAVVKYKASGSTTHFEPATVPWHATDMNSQRPRSAQRASAVAELLGLRCGAQIMGFAR